MNSKRRAYHLEVCPGTSLQSPKDEEIEAAIRSLPGGVPSFVILSKKKNDFMQAGGGPRDGFQLEYQEFSADGLWEHEDSVGGRVDVETVVNAILAYARDEESWRNLPWKRLSKEESDKRAAKALQDWQAKQPQEGFFTFVAKGLLGLALENLGIGGSRKSK
jgi:hypothetical protein